MPVLANLLLAAAFLCALAASAGALAGLYTGLHTGPHVTMERRPAAGDAPGRTLAWVEKGQFLAMLLLGAASLILTAAFATHDFSLVYVSGHSDRSLPLFYRLTAFWAGQEGSLLFWAWSVALCGSIFGTTRAYARQSIRVKLWFWAFFAGIMAFFLLLLGTWSNPFLVHEMTPVDGSGLNPLLQDPGMIFHPPLLFLGYGGFTVPCCLALAHALGQAPTRPPEQHGGKKKKNAAPGTDGGERWAAASRPFILTAWLFLSAGIILGAWWAYMELGWGGYWGWDPVENASLVPWLIATACLHTGIVEERRGKLGRANVFLMALTTISAFFATYIVRGNVVRSVHAFGDSATGVPLLLFTATFLGLAAYAALRAPARGKPLESPFSREGLLCLVAWILLALAAIILLATLWPVLSRLWSEKSVGLGPSFYNYACLPFFALLALLLAFCPWVRWEGGLRAKLPVLAILALCLASAGVLASLGLANPLALAATAAGVGIIATVCMLFSSRTELLRLPKTVAAHGVHLGFALMVLGVAFSGPYKVERDLSMRVGQGFAVGEYSFVLLAVRGGDSHDHMRGDDPRALEPPAYIYRETEIAVSKGGQPAGTLRPQLRVYAKTPGMPSTEAYTLFSLGNELYATFLGMNGNAAVVRVSINPLVNWIWIGGVALCLFPFLGLRRARRRPLRKRAEAAGETGEDAGRA